MRLLVSNLRFPLCMLIVFMHCNPLLFCVNVHKFNFVTFEFAQTFAMEFVFRLCVPLFFIISGYLFFLSFEKFTTQVYKEKLYRRLFSLLLPYLVWNLIFFFLYYIGSLFIGPMPSEKPVTDFTFSDFFWSFWNLGHVYNNPSFTGLVLDIPLWFVRDLMVMSIFSPIVYSLLVKTKGFVLILFGIIWVGEFQPTMYAPSDQALFFFSLGAFAGIKKLSLPDKWGDNRCFLFLAIYFILFVLIALFSHNKIRWMKHLNDLIGIVSFLLLFFHFTQRKGQWFPTNISGASFFLYAFFTLPLLLSQKIIVPIFEEYGNVGMFISYFLCPSLVIFVGLLLYMGITRFFPTWISRLLTGGR